MSDDPFERPRSNHRELPHNDEAERSLLGAAMLSSDAAAVAVSEVTTGDFYHPKHQAIHAAMVELYNMGIGKMDPVMLKEEISLTNPDPTLGVYLIDMMTQTPSTSAARHYANLVVEQATLRDLVRVGAEVTELGYTSRDAASAVDDARSLMGSVDLPIGNVEPSPNVKDIIEREIRFDWQVEGLLERRDRLILTGPEGGGKSTFLRQIATCLAAGIHPFTFVPVDPVRVLVIDVENSEMQVQRKIEPLYRIAEHKIEPDNLRIEVRTQGLDLLSRHDHRWFLERVAANKPDVLITGPIYKLHTEDPNAEQPARKLAAVFDSIRGRFGCSLILEAHSGHGNGLFRPVRPIGASLWLRWPEFGYGLSPVPVREGEPDVGLCNWTPWRGPRDVREWPRQLQWGEPGTWPWVDPYHRAAEGL